MAHPIVSKTLLETFELMGQSCSDDTVRLMLERLHAYKGEDGDQTFKEEHLVKALEKCQRECRRVYLVDILERLPKKRVLIT